ncbi:hypothetical protein AADC60_24580 [Cytobacillus pseudoceanisediminis]|uniref:Uncharacterized protein n=1 Tax=Cytobacillus pseudoceanisediminis TaxID=3051614 RepID=A0ABZ2ZKG5_9BACI
MTEGIILKEAVSQSLIKEIKASIDHFDYEMRKAYDEEKDLRERIQLLELTMEKTHSEMAKGLIRNMIDECQTKLADRIERARNCKNNKKYYQEIFEALDEAIKSI